MGGLKHWTGYINSGQTNDIKNVNGLVFIRVGYSFGGYLLYIATFGKVSLIANTSEYSISIELSHDTNHTLTIKNTANAQRYVEVYYQTLQIER